MALTAGMNCRRCHGTLEAHDEHRDVVERRAVLVVPSPEICMPYGITWAAGAGWRARLMHTVT
jgi:hypothetical protein